MSKCGLERPSLVTIKARSGSVVADGLVSGDEGAGERHLLTESVLILDVLIVVLAASERVW